jgi:hypothetical protein
MAWVRIDDHFDEHPKLARVGPLGWGVWLAGLAYCNRNLTDGFIPWEKARTLSTFEIVEDDGRLMQLAVTSGMGGDDLCMEFVIDLLVRAGLWDVVRKGERISGYRIHDYGDYQPSKADILAERERTKQRQTAFRQRHTANNRNGQSNDVTKALVTPTVTAMSRRPQTQEETQDVKEKTLSGPKEKKERKRRTNLWHIVPADWAGPTDAHRKLAVGLGVDCDLELAKFLDYEFDKPKSDADRAFSNWLRNAAKFKPATRPASPRVNEMPKSSAPRTGRAVRADGLDPEAEQLKREREENAAIDAWAKTHQPEAKAILETIAEEMRTDLRWRGTPAGIVQGVARGLYRTRVLERMANGNGAAIA